MRYKGTMHVSDEVAKALDENVERALISSREGAANTTLSYLRGDIIANNLNSVFGPLGWEVSAKIDRIDAHEATRKGYNGKPDRDVFVVQVVTSVTLTIKPTVPGGTSTSYTQSGLGYGEVEIDKQRKDAYNMAVKGADTDGMKRCATFLGRALGMFLIDGVQDDIDYAHNGGKNKTAARKKARDLRRRDREDEEDRLEREANRRNDGGDRDGDDRGNDNRGGDNRGGSDRGGNDRGESSGTGNRGGSRDDGNGDRDDRGADRQQGGTRASGNGTGRGQASQSHDDRNDDRQTDDRGNGASQDRDDGATKGGGRGSASTDKAPAAKDDAGKTDAGKGAASKADAGKGEGAPAAQAAYDDNYNLQEIPVTRQQMIDFGATIVKQAKGLTQVKDRNKLVEQHAHTILKVLDHKISSGTIKRLGEAGVDVERLLS